MPIQAKTMFIFLEGGKSAALYRKTYDLRSTHR